MKDKPIKVRKSVQRFAEEMERVLRQNDHKGNPEYVSFNIALERMWEEVRELDRVGYGHVSIETTRVQRKEMQKEAVDVANFALMAWYGAAND